MGLVRTLQRVFEGLERRSLARFGPAWEDPELTAALTQVEQGRIGAAVELMAVSTAPASRSLRSWILGDSLEPHLEALRTPDDPHALLLAGAARIARAWDIRGGGYAKYTGAEQFRGFHAELAQAREPLYRAVELAPDDPAPWYHLQLHGIGSELPRRELDRVWDELRQRDPANFPGAFGRVQAISEKWHGGPGESAGFAEELVATAEPGRPITAIAAAAHLEIAWRQMDDSDGTSGALLRRYFSDPRVAGLMHRASGLWAQEPRPHPQDREAHHLLGAAHYFAGHHDQARFHLTHAGDTMPRTLPWSVPALLPGRYYRKVRRELGL